MQPQVVVLPLETISIGDRQRTVDPGTEKHIVELRESIGVDGLIHAIAVDRDHKLVAGFCRLSAVRELKLPYKYASSDIAPGFVPAVVVHQEDSRSLHRLELMENLRRRNLTPIDEAKAIAALHGIFSEGNPDWGMEDTGKELDKLRGESRVSREPYQEVADSVLLAGFEGDAEVSAAPSRKAAVKIARKKLEQQFKAALGDIIVPDSTDFSILQGSCIEVLKTLPDSSFHGIIVDPPYAIGADDFGDQTMKGGEHEYSDDWGTTLPIIRAIFKEGLRVCKDDAHLYLFCDERFFPELKGEAAIAGWKVFQSSLVWDKVNIGHAPWPGFFSKRTERILFAMKGTRKLERSRSDLFSFVADKDKVHAAQKPVDLYVELMKLSFLPGEAILDPCAGSGVIFKAAKKAGMRATGIELSEKYASICKTVIAEL